MCVYVCKKEWKKLIEKVWNNIGESEKVREWESTRIRERELERENKWQRIRERDRESKWVNEWESTK